MEVWLTLKPGQRGTKKLHERYGDRLVCVRYRYDTSQCKRYKTIELIEHTAEWIPPPEPMPDTIVLVAVAWGEEQLARLTRYRVLCQAVLFQYSLFLWLTWGRALSAYRVGQGHDKCAQPLAAGALRTSFFGWAQP